MGCYTRAWALNSPIIKTASSIPGSVWPVCLQLFDEYTTIIRQFSCYRTARHIKCESKTQKSTDSPSNFLYFLLINNHNHNIAAQRNCKSTFSIHRIRKGKIMKWKKNTMNSLITHFTIHFAFLFEHQLKCNSIQWNYFSFVWIWYLLHLRNNIHINIKMP